MLGFVFIGILFFFIIVIVVVFYDEGVESVGNCIYLWFGFIFVVVIYMFIGVFYGILCVVNVVYEIGIRYILFVYN